MISKPTISADPNVLPFNQYCLINEDSIEMINMQIVFKTYTPQVNIMLADVLRSLSAWTYLHFIWISLNFVYKGLTNNK